MVQADLDPEIQLQVAAVVFPIIALVVSFAIDSVEDEGWAYRAFVGGFGMAAIIPALVVVILSIFGSLLGFTADGILGHLVLSFLATTSLVVGVLLHEVLKDLDDEHHQRIVVFLIVVALAIVAAIMRVIG